MGARAAPLSSPSASPSPLPLCRTPQPPSPSPSLLSPSHSLLSLARHPRRHRHRSLCRPPPWRRCRRRRSPATLFAITLAIFVAVAVTLDSPLCHAPPSHLPPPTSPNCHAPPSHLPPNVDCLVIAVTIALVTLAVALFALCRLPLSPILPPIVLLIAACFIFPSVNSTQPPCP